MLTDWLGFLLYLLFANMDYNILIEHWHFVRLWMNIIEFLFLVSFYFWTSNLLRLMTYDLWHAQPLYERIRRCIMLSIFWFQCIYLYRGGAVVWFGVVLYCTKGLLLEDNGMFKDDWLMELACESIVLQSYWPRIDCYLVNCLFDSDMRWTVVDWNKLCF